MDLRRLKGLISLGALAIVLARVIWPEIRIDAVSLGLVAIAILPWLSPIIKSVELPGGLKITMQDIQDAGDRVVGGGSVVVSPGPASLTVTGYAPTVVVSAPDPNLEFVGFRVEIEGRLRTLAEKAGIAPQQGASQLAYALSKAGVLRQDQVSGLQTLIEAGNKAAHGVKIPDGVSVWAKTRAPQVIAVLDALIAKA